MPRGVPKIKVKYDLDANGILTVTATEESTGASQNITIQHQKGNLDQSDIDRMVAEAEKYKEEDEKARAKVEAKNGLENYCFQIQGSTSQMQNLSDEDKEALNKHAQEVLDWMDQNQDVSKEEYESKQKDLQEKVQPIMMKGMPQQGAPGGCPVGCQVECQEACPLAIPPHKKQLLNQK